MHYWNMIGEWNSTVEKNRWIMSPTEKFHPLSTIWLFNATSASSQSKIAFTLIYNQRKFIVGTCAIFCWGTSQFARSPRGSIKFCMIRLSFISRSCGIILPAGRMGKWRIAYNFMAWWKLLSSCSPMRLEWVMDARAYVRILCSFNNWLPVVRLHAKHTHSSHCAIFFAH